MGEAHEHDPRARLAARLAGADWRRGITKAELGEKLDDDPALRAVVDLHLSDELYFSSRDLVGMIPEHAWQAVQGDARRGASPPAEMASMASFGEPSVADVPPPSDDLAPGPVQRVAGQAAQTVGQVAHVVTHAAGHAVQVVTGNTAKVAEQARERAGAVGQAAAGVGLVPDRVREGAVRARDQVVSVATRGDDARPFPTPTVGPVQRAIPVALSAAMEGLGQAYNRQPGKALAFTAAGLGLSTASGLNTWLARTVFRAKRVRLGPERVRPFLLGLWTAAYLANLLDAWSNAGPNRASWATPGIQPSPPASWADVAGGAARAAISPSAATDQFPTVGGA